MNGPLGRQRNAELYRKQLAGSPVVFPAPVSYQTRHIYNQFVIRADRRDGLRNRLTERGIGSEIYYPLPLHLQKCFAYLGYREGDFPVSERLATRDFGAADISRADTRRYRVCVYAHTQLLRVVRQLPR